MESRHIYLDHAASSPMDKDVLEKMVPYLTFPSTMRRKQFAR